MKVIKSYLPVFNGFYSTLFEYEGEEQDIVNYNEEHGTDYNYDHFTFDYEEYKRRIGKECVSAIWNELNHLFSNIKSPEIQMEFEKVSSPRFYNYVNDSINVTYTMDEFMFNKIVGYLKENEAAFNEFLVDRYTSRSGFASFWANNSETWFDTYLVDEEKLTHCFGAILEFVFFNEGYTDEDLLDGVSGEQYVEFELNK